MLKINREDLVVTRTKEATQQVPSMTKNEESKEIKQERAILQPLPTFEKKPKLFARLKKVKHIEVYVAGFVVLVMIAIYASNFLGGASDSGVYSQIQANQNQFAREMEARLVSTLSQVRGAGRVSAMVTVTGSARLEIAYNVNENTVTQNTPGGASNITTTIVKTPVIINGRDGPQPLVLLEIKPQLRGVVIVAEGARDIAVRLALLRAVQTLVSDESVSIEILAGR